MGTNTLYNDINSIVNLRKGIAMILEEGIVRLNMGETEYLKSALKRISEYEGYEVVLNCKNTFIIHGHLYGGGKDKTTLIKENGKILFIIYKDKDSEKTCLCYSSHYLFNRI